MPVRAPLPACDAGVHKLEHRAGRDRRSRSPGPLLAARRGREGGRPMAGKRLGIGVVGAGRWANWAHLPGWARDSRCEIVAVCDRELDRAKAAGEKYGAKVVTADYTDLLERDDIQIIDVITRDSEHYP